MIIISIYTRGKSRKVVQLDEYHSLEVAKPRFSPDFETVSLNRLEIVPPVLQILVQHLCSLGKLPFMFYILWHIPPCTTLLALPLLWLPPTLPYNTGIIPLAQWYKWCQGRTCVGYLRHIVQIFLDELLF